MKVRDLMTRDVATVPSSAKCGEAATLMRQEDCGSIPVVEDGRLVGIVTDRDIVVRGLAAGKDPIGLSVSEVMSADPVTITPDADVEEAARLMAERQIRRLPVIENGRLVGIVVIGQIARREKDEEVTGETLKEISEPPSGRASHARG